MINGCAACGGHLAGWKGTYLECVQCRSLQVTQTEGYEDAAILPYLSANYHAQGEDRGLVYAKSRLEALSAAIGHTGRLLEVGAGTGLFADAALKHGFDVQAIEPGARYTNAVGLIGERALPLRWEEKFEQDDYPYDAIVAWEVIEHLANPAAFVRAALANLKPTGVLMISTPNARSWSILLLGEKDPMLCPEEHLRLFSRAGLTNLLLQSRFRDVELRGFGFLLKEEVRGSLKRRNMSLPGPLASAVSAATRPVGRTRLSLGIEAIARPSRADQE